MLARPVRLALALSLALPGVTAAQGFEYAAGSARYRITQNTKAAQEMMGQKQEFESSSNQLLSVSIARAATDTLEMTVVLDSISATSPLGPTPGIDKLIGLRIVAKISPFGAYYSSVKPSDDSIPNASQIADAMGSFLPRIRGTLAAGSTWTDTVSSKMNQGGIDLDRKTVSTYTVMGDTAIGTDRSWKIQRETSTTMAGSGMSQGQQMTMDGTSRGTGVLLVSPQGVFLGGEGAEDALIKIVLAANGMEIGVTTNSTTKVEKVK